MMRMNFPVICMVAFFFAGRSGHGKSKRIVRTPDRGPASS